MIYYLTALINGFFNSVNRMTNVRAGKLFGTANGALINYVEATVLSLLLMLVLKNGKELSWGYIVSVPWWVYLGSICGLLAQLLQIVGTLRLKLLVGITGTHRNSHCTKLLCAELKADTCSPQAVGRSNLDPVLIRNSRCFVTTGKHNCPIVHILGSIRNNNRLSCRSR